MQESGSAFPNGDEGGKLSGTQPGEILTGKQEHCEITFFMSEFIRWCLVANLGRFDSQTSSASLSPGKFAERFPS